MNNIIGGQGNCVVTKTAKTIEGYGFNDSNCIKVILPGKPNQSWVPDGTLNTLTGVIPAQTGLYVIGKGADQDKTADFYPDGTVPSPGGGGGGTNYSAATNAYLARFNAESGVTALSTTDKDALDTYLNSLSTQGILPKILDLKISWGGAAGAKLNIVGPNFKDIWTNVTYGRLGSFGNGTTGYARSGFIPDVHFPGQFNYSFGAWVNVTADAGKIATGVTSAGRSMYILPKQGGVCYVSAHSANTSPAMPGIVDSDGFLVVSRTAADDVKVYRNGGQIGSNSNTEITALPSIEFYDWAQNVDGTINAPSDIAQAIRFKGAGLTAAEVANFTNATSLFLQAVD